MRTKARKKDGTIIAISLRRFPFVSKHAHDSITFVIRLNEVIALAAIKADVGAVAAVDDVVVIAGVALVEVGDGALVEVVVVVAVEAGRVLLREVAVQYLALADWPSLFCFLYV